MNEYPSFHLLEKKADTEDSPAEAAAPKEEEAEKQEGKSDEVGGAVSSCRSFPSHSQPD